MIKKVNNKGVEKEIPVTIVDVEEYINKNAPIIGHNTTSETSTVQVFEGEGIKICDSPGYSDTNGPIKDVVN